MKKALILGLGKSGQSAQSFLEKRGFTVIGVDDKTAPKEISDITAFSLFVPSPGIPRTHPLYIRAKEAGIEIAGEAELALREVKSPCIAVTGSNGKTTTVKMIEHVLNTLGKKAKAVGNVGDPLTQYANETAILVVELSSFQLETLHARIFDVGLILNITENHLDRYDSFHEYGQTKCHLQKCIKENGELFLHEQVLSRFSFSSSFKTFKGSNEEAAFVAVSCFGIDRSSFDQALQTFTKPAHRVEFVSCINGVSYYNDSKATSVVAMLHGIQSVKGKVVLLVGGRDKGLAFEPINAFKERLSCVIVFGEAQVKIKKALDPSLAIYTVSTVQEAVERAAQHAKEAEVVLFSPGCASYDAFSNYEERGEEFKRCVHKLEGRP